VWVCGCFQQHHWPAGSENSGIIWLIGVCLRLVFSVYFLAAGRLFIDWQEKNADTRGYHERTASATEDDWSLLFLVDNIWRKKPQIRTKRDGTHSSMGCRDERSHYHSSSASATTLVDCWSPLRWPALRLDVNHDPKSRRRCGKFQSKFRWILAVLCILRRGAGQKFWTEFPSLALADRLGF
jgi:hypothetical protein